MNSNCNNSSVIFRHGSTSSSIVRSERTHIRGKCERYFSALDSWVLWRAILIGQVLSVLLCTTAVITQVLTSRFGIVAPTAQNFLVYVLMCLTFTTVLACRTGDDGLLNVLKDRWWRYFLVAVLDVEANYLVVKAYQYTTLTSIQLLDCFTIPVVLLLSWVVMHVRFKIIHIVGVSVSLMGIGCLVWADADSSIEMDKAVENRLTGDMVCMAGAFFYGVTNVAEEHFIKKYDQVEFLGMLGLFGTVISGLQLALAEHPQVSNMNWHHWEEIGLMVAYSVALYAFYATVPLVLTALGSTALNLSLLSADYFSLIAGVALFHYKFHALYAMSFVFFVSGVVIFCSKKTSKHNDDQELRGTYSLVYFVNVSALLHAGRQTKVFVVR